VTRYLTITQILFLHARLIDEIAAWFRIHSASIE
jgi:hypothetical protein